MYSSYSQSIFWKKTQKHIFFSVKVKVQLAKLSRVIERDEKTTADKRMELVKRVLFWMFWAFVTGGVLYGIWEIGYVANQILKLS